MNRWGIPSEMETVIRERDQACIYCGIVFAETDSRDGSRKGLATWEHIVNDASLVTLENIALCCNSCNASKGSKELAAASTIYTSETMPFRQPTLQLHSATGCVILLTLTTLLASIGGCKARTPGSARALPVMHSADEEQYFPAGPEFKLPPEAVALQDVRDEEERIRLLRDADNSNSSTP